MSLSSPGRLLSNTAWNIIGRFTAVVASVILTPYLIDRLGMERFGLWALANLLVGYFSLADLGVQASLVRQIAFCRPDENPEKLSQIVSTTFFVFMSAFVVCASIAIVVPPAVLDRLGAAGLGEEGILVVRIVFGTMFLSISFAALNAILPGVQRMDISNRLGMIQSLTLLGGSVAVVENGFGVPGVVLVMVGGTIFQGLASYLVARRLFPRFRLLETYLDHTTWSELLHFGWRIQLSRICDFGTFTFDRLFLSAAGGVAALGLYQPAVQVATQSRMLPFLVVQAFLPYASELSAAGESEKLRKIYSLGTLYLSFVAFALLGFLIAFAPWLTTAWLGPGFEPVATWIRIFCAGYLVNVPLSLGGLVSQAIGRPGIQARSALLGTVLNLVLAPLGYWVAGVTGLTVGATVAVVAASIWFAIKLHRVLEVTTAEIYETALRAPAMFWTPATLVALAVVSQANPQGRIASLAALAVGGLAWAAYAWFCARRLDLFAVKARLEAL